MKTQVKGASGGKFAGKKVVVKDTYCLAGVPPTTGASVIKDYVPEFDAPIISRSRSRAVSEKVFARSA